MATKKSKRPGLGVNPLDALMGDSPVKKEMINKPVKTKTVKEEKKQAPKETKKIKAKIKVEPSKPIKKESQTEGKERKIRTTYHLPEPLVEGLRDAAMHLAGPPEYLTLSALVEQALQKELTRLQKKHTKGDSFPKRPRNLRGGRPSR
jgi:hypothetical protein